jgi:hypothetical protein
VHAEEVFFIFGGLFFVSFSGRFRYNDTRGVVGQSVEGIYMCRRGDALLARKTQSVSVIKIEWVFREKSTPEEEDRIWRKLAELLAKGGE